MEDVINIEEDFHYQYDQKRKFPLGDGDFSQRKYGIMKNVSYHGSFLSYSIKIMKIFHEVLNLWFHLWGIWMPINQLTYMVSRGVWSPTLLERAPLLRNILRSPLEYSSTMKLFLWNLYLCCRNITKLNHSI